jgi:16S rRNA (cytosine967-C5)-methyltransferase
MYYQSYANTAIELIHRYDGKIPLQHYLKKFFSANKKFGSRDRKYITGACYAFFRLGHGCLHFPAGEKILIGIFLCDNSPSELLKHFRPEWNENIHLPLEQKLSLIGPAFRIKDIFPWKAALSKGIDHDAFCESFLVQPDLYLRIRPGKEEVVKAKLSGNHISFSSMGDSCISLGNSTGIDRLLRINKEVVVQDYASQQTVKFMQDPGPNLSQQLIRVWDCCAGSGGKSIMLFDANINIKLVVSDNRKSILANLKKRFREAGVADYQSFLADLSVKNANLPIRDLDLIIADVPCSGSGTWGRTPESLFSFNETSLDRFSILQKKIIENIAPCLKKTGRLVYITCSVFKKENEEIAEFILSRFNLKLEKMQVLKGYDRKADTMFVATFIA